MCGATLRCALALCLLPLTATGAERHIKASSVPWVGVLLAAETIDVAAEVPGRVIWIGPRVGERVSAGAPLVTIDGRIRAADARAASATVGAALAEQVRARNELAHAEEQLVRTEALAARGLVSGEELSKARGARHELRARLDAAAARVREQRSHAAGSRLRVEAGRPRAPTDAIVAARLVEPGVAVVVGTPLVRLVSQDRWLVRFAVPEHDLPRIASASTVDIVGGPAGLRLQGQVSSIAPEVDEASRSVFVEAMVGIREARRPDLRSGMQVQVSPAPAEVRP